MELASKYSPEDVEGKWYEYWMQHKLFSSKPDGRKPFTVVIPPPNVTGVLHMGHMLTDAAAISAAIVWLYLADELHSPHLGRSRQGAGGEGIDEGLYGVGAVVERTADARYEMHHVRVVLEVFVEIHLHIVAVA